MSIAGFYQPAEVPAQPEFLGHTPYGAKRSRELHAVHHRGSLRILAELMNVAEPLERTPYLLVYEVVGFCISVILLVICSGTPKCQARQATCSSKEMRPDVTPSIASS